MINYMPALGEIVSFIKQIPRSKYPISAEELVELAKKYRVDREIVDFYSSFPPDTVFEDQEDILTRSELIEILEQEAKEMPPEIWVAPEED